MPNPYSGIYVFYYIFAAFSFCCSLYVTKCILSLNSIKSASTRIVLYLHLTLLIEDIASLPFIFTGNHGFCKFMGFVKYYSGLANICVVGLMIILYRAILLQVQPVKDFVARSSEYIIFVFPLITLLPFITDSYVGYNHCWCVLDGTENAQLWSIFVFYLWAWLLILITILVISKTLYEVFKVNQELAAKLFNTIGMYTLVSVICWIPRSVNRAQRLFGKRTIIGYYGDTIVLFLSGFLYFLIFLTEKTGVIKFETEDDANFRFSSNSDASTEVNPLSKLSILSSTNESEMLERLSTYSIDGRLSKQKGIVPISRPSIVLDAESGAASYHTEL